MSPGPFVLGLDLGTSGARAVVADPDGRVVASSAAPLPPPVVDGERREQEAGLWVDAAFSALGQAAAALRADGADPRAIEALAVDATSATVVPVDGALTPLRPGILYNDSRATGQAARLNDAGGAVLARLGYRFNATFALPKVLWLMEHEPAVMDAAALVLHQADLVVARLLGAGPPATDPSNALKTGYDIIDGGWPDYLADVGLDAARLPAVVPMGAVIGTVGAAAAGRLGLSPSCRIVTGMTDGTAACAASGARAVGDMSTTLGTTMVWRTIAAEPVSDPEGRLYSHRHPNGAFLPGAASNAGGAGVRDLMEHRFPGSGDRLDAFAAGLPDGGPMACVTYPLSGRGERYPFVDPDFVPFTDCDGDAAALYRSCLDGAACIERWGYEVAAGLGAPCTGRVWTTGRGALVPPWMETRANALGRPVYRAAHPESAFGSALVAAMAVWHGGDWTATADRMIGEAARVDPDPAQARRYDDLYGRFRAEVARRR